MLVTFLFRGSPDTRNVLVLRIPLAAAAPDDYFMRHLDSTDLWYATVLIPSDMRFDYTLAINVPPLHGLASTIDRDTIAMVAASARPDPLNPHRFRTDANALDPPELRGTSVLEMPNASPQPYLAARPGVPQGQIVRSTLQSKLLNSSRTVSAYLPPAYAPSAQPYPLLILFDADAHLGDSHSLPLVPTPTILDNLIADHRIPPLVVLFLYNPPGARYQDLACNPVFSDYLASELLPWARREYHLTPDPQHVVVAGSSLGGLAAACAGLRHSESFGNVLSQSGSFWWAPPSAATTSPRNSAPNWIANQFILSPKLPLRFYLSAGSDELDFSGQGNSILLTSRNLRDVLLAKSYDVQFVVFPGNHDYLSWRATLPDALIFLLAPSH